MEKNASILKKNTSKNKSAVYKSKLVSARYFLFKQIL
jgi:hypothetical protein